jgi:hypothetical protein
VRFERAEVNRSCRCSSRLCRSLRRDLFVRVDCALMQSDG